MRYRHKFNQISQSPLSLALAVAFLLPTSAYAQNTPAELDGVARKNSTQEPPTPSTDLKATDLDKVTVTGSRITRDTFNSPSPVQVITRDETTLSGFNSTTAVLQSNAVTGGSEQINNAFSGYVVNGGPGVNTLSLRGLGANRTLILVNGRRMAPSGSRGAVGSVDLNTLPNIAVERIEILKDGASSIYGSDAVAGVVNIITKQKVNGPSVEFQHNATQDGGGDETRWSFITGASGDRWRVSGSFDLYHREELTLGQRGWASKCPVPLAGRKPDGSYGAKDYIDPATGEPKCWGIDAGGTTINTLGTAYMLGRPGVGNLGYYGTYDPKSLGKYGGLDSFNRWRPNPAVTDGALPGYEGVDYYGRDTYDPRYKKQSLISPVTNYTGFLQGGFDLQALGNAELYWEVLASRRESKQTGYLQHIIDYPTGSPLLGNLSRLKSFMPGPADGSTNGKPVSARAFIGWGPYQSTQGVNFFRATTGLRGSLGSSWNYDGYISYAKSNANYYSQNRLTNRIAKTVDVVSDGNGGYVCRDTSDGCVAAPMLSPETLAGNLPQAYRDYIMQWTHGNTVYAESTLNFGVNGPLFDLPYGSVNAAFGVEYRRSRINDTPDENSIANNLYNFTASTPTRGSDAVKEAYAELEVPLLSGLPGAEELRVNLSGRYTDYDSYGSDRTWKIGFLYTPVKWLSLRGSRGTSFRAPALFEQFLGSTSGFTSASSDPCNNWAEKDRSSNNYLNCQSLGLPAKFEQTSSVAVYQQGGAKTGLEAETSTALTAGIVLQPEFPTWFGNLSFAADYYDIEVNNGVSRLSGSQILSLCYGSPAADFNARTGYCNLVTRSPTNTLSVISGYLNVATDIVRGWDFTLRYTRDIGPGEFRVNAQVTRYLEQSGKTFPSDPLRNYVGTLNAPTYTGQLGLTYKIYNWLVHYELDWTGAINGYKYYEKYYNRDYRPDYQMKTSDYFLSNISLQYKGDDWSVTGGLRNLTDKQPPRVSTGMASTIGNAPLYSGLDYFGRSFFLRFSKDF